MTVTPDLMGGQMPFFDDHHSLADLISFDADEHNLLSSWLDSPAREGHMFDGMGGEAEKLGSSPFSPNRPRVQQPSSTAALPSSSQGAATVTSKGAETETAPGTVTASASTSAPEQDANLPSPALGNTGILQTLRSLAPDVRESLLGGDHPVTSSATVAPTPSGGPASGLQSLYSAVNLLPATSEDHTASALQSSNQTEPNPAGSHGPSDNSRRSSTARKQATASATARSKLKPDEKRKRNKAAAERYRAKKRRENEEMKKLVHILREQVSLLQQRCQRLEIENNTLRTQAQQPYQSFPPSSQPPGGLALGGSSTAGPSMATPRSSSAQQARREEAVGIAGQAASGSMHALSAGTKGQQKAPPSALHAGTAFVPQAMYMHAGGPGMQPSPSLALAVPSTSTTTSGQEPPRKRSRQGAPGRSETNGDGSSSTGMGTGGTTNITNVTNDASNSGTNMNALIHHLQQLQQQRQHQLLYPHLANNTAAGPPNLMGLNPQLAMFLQQQQQQQQQQPQQQSKTEAS